MNLKFEHVAGPFGDATSAYKVTFPKGITVSEFIDYIVNDYSVNSPDTWGFLELSRFGQHRFLEYNRGEDKLLSASILTDIKDKEILHIRAEGGWSRMDYILTLKE